MAREKVSHRVLATPEEAFMLADEIALASAKNTQVKAKKESAIAEIRDLYAPELAGLKKKIDNGIAVLLPWSKEHSEQFGELRHITTTHAVFGFDLNKAHVGCTLSGVEEDDFSQATAGIKLMPRAFRERFLRTRIELDVSEVSKALKEDKADAQHLRKLGLDLVQTETFSVKPKAEADPAAKLKTVA